MGQVVLYPAATGDDGYSWSTFFKSGVTEANMLGVSSGYKSTVYFRFPSASIPQGATISSAELKVYAKYNESTALVLKIYGNDADNAVAPTSVAETNALTRTTAYKDWTAPSFTADQSYTVDITDPIQEIINRAGWASGNALQIIIESVTDSGTSTRWADQYDTGSHKAVLTVNYADPPNITWKKLAYDAEVVKHSLATAANDFLVAPASGSFVKKTLAETQAILGLGNYLPLSGGTLSGSLGISAGNSLSVGDSYIDHIYEQTAEHGVAIDGLTIKDGDITLSGGQIAFPATADPSTGANTLDDYEEGTWTPALSSTGATFSYSFQTGNYTKIGRQVFLYFLIALTGAPTGTLTNVVLMTGLPFSIGTGSLNGFTSFSMDMSKSPTLLDNSSSTAHFRDTTGTQLTAAIFTGASYFYGFLTHC